jgi:hypothetical protein
MTARALPHSLALHSWSIANSDIEANRLHDPGRGLTCRVQQHLRPNQVDAAAQHVLTITVPDTWGQQRSETPTIARSCANTSYKRDSVNLQTCDTSSDHRPDPDRQASVGQVLSGLTETQRDILHRYYTNGQRSDRISADLDISVQYVNITKAIAKALIAEHFNRTRDLSRRNPVT